MKDKQLEALIKKMSAKAAAEKAKAARFEDPTLKATKGGERDDEREQMFKEMKRREF